MARSTTQRDKDRATIAKAKPPCHLCGQPIDYTLSHPHPDSYVVDHIVPLAKGGDDTLSNKAAAHRGCNRAKGYRLDGGPVVRRSGSLVRPGG